MSHATAAGEAHTTSCNDARIHTFGVLLEAMAHLNRTFDRSLQTRIGINQSLFEGLLRLERSGGELSMGALADQIALTSGGVTRMVARLVEAGYAERRSCEADRRVQYVAITDSGRDVLSRALAVHLEDLEEHFTGKLSPDERRTIVDVMERIRPHHS
ncbi:MAG TPA: MarR family transcriptional regulator [Acidimicrobiia bacterium]